jgi:metal-dependent amidase/aminoacylase/carboxypeptidase family protein
MHQNLLLNKMNNAILCRTSDSDFGVITISEISSSFERNIQNKEEPLNTIPEYATIKGITRFRDEYSKLKIIEGLKDLVNEYKSKLINIRLSLLKRAVPTLNNPIMVSYVKKSVKDFGLNLVEKRTKWRDDAGWGSEKAPTAHGFIGVDNNNNVNSLHTSFFNPSEKGLEIGLKIFLNSIKQSFSK